ncbi:MAG TPA: hypothetical protein VN213_14405 [Solirubrobacteraceae bacterium]|nr:hypothetical protein [Solirubrobacteraceae bacterium]
MPTAGEVADEMAAIATGGAILTFALFPFAVPMIALTIIALVPLLVVGLAAGLVVALFAAPVVMVRRLRRRCRGHRHHGVVAARRDRLFALGWRP